MLIRRKLKLLPKTFLTTTPLIQTLIVVELKGIFFRAIQSNDKVCINGLVLCIVWQIQEFSKTSNQTTQLLNRLLLQFKALPSQRDGLATQPGRILVSGAVSIQQSPEQQLVQNPGFVIKFGQVTKGQDLSLGAVSLITIPKQLKTRSNVNFISVLKFLLIINSQLDLYGRFFILKKLIKQILFMLSRFMLQNTIKFIYQNTVYSTIKWF